jgi:hypothetical protein
MAARRLVAVLVVMLVLSTVAAVLVPAPRRPIGTDTTTTSSTMTRSTEPDRTRGRLVTATMHADRPRPPVKLHVGDELRLRVISTRSDQVKLDGFGLVEAVDRDAPATFDVFADHAGRFDAVLLDSHRMVGRIVVTPRRAAE